MRDSRSAFSCPAHVAFMEPFRVIRPDDEPDFSASLQAINSNTYDSSRLTRIVTSLPLDSGDTAPALICGDGAIAIPCGRDWRSINEVVDAINEVLCSLLLSGLLCDAVDARDVTTGNLHESKSIWPTLFGRSLSSHQHSTLRMRIAGGFERIALDTPENTSVSVFHKRHEEGRAILKAIPTLSATLLINGATELRFGNSMDALSNLWMVVEQLTEHLWKSRFLADSSLQPASEIKGRRKSLEQDTRTWSTSVRQEILFQVNVLPEQTYSKLHAARRARNELAHQGKRPTPSLVHTLFDGILDLIELSTSSSLPGIRNLAQNWNDPSEFLVEGDESHWRAVASKFAPS